ncbi:MULTISPECIES: hypothetical protein [Burkholderia]|uniref:hypothetical protein n=1 Tax=Burkholderia TaxID=32008 RepID=UPI0000F291D4|nr:MULTISPECIES: hypothetical protein [Burkholderia]ABN81476.1 hypothetical protein BURPS668_2972 [Burkholderia pseudomallei 668]AIV50894.1 hypothetical protein Y603_1860 [Burkholderia pseudomallei MSHR1153]AJX73369.1 hypothetical protein BG19_2069 [Burkholderia pseudomallei MSHR840]AJX87113.1 hypothetical protein BH02_1254 [Burkholderia pseudomallei]ALJ71095.1 hypothetical protein TR70_1549 [Burkholderia pseudomallei]
MAKQGLDKYTADMFGNRPGRPAKPNAMTGAQRAANFRARRRLIPVMRNENSCEWCGADERGCSVCGLPPSQVK